MQAFSRIIGSRKSCDLHFQHLFYSGKREEGSGNTSQGMSEEKIEKGQWNVFLVFPLDLFSRDSVRHKCVWDSAVSWENRLLLLLPLLPLLPLLQSPKELFSLENTREFTLCINWENEKGYVYSLILLSYPCLLALESRKLWVCQERKWPLKLHPICVFHWQTTRDRKKTFGF